MSLTKLVYDNVTDLTLYWGNINFRNKFGYTPLNVAASMGYTDLAILLLTHPDINVNQANIFGYTPLHWAVELGNTNLVQVLIEHGANVNCTNFYRDTPLHIAQATGRKNLIGLLLEQPDIITTKVNNSGRTYDSYESNGL